MLSQILASAVVGFISASVVQLLSLWWRDRAEKAQLRQSLYCELAAIYVELRELLASLRSWDDADPNPADLGAIVRPECYDAAKASPVFWRLADALGIVEAHRNFQYLLSRDPPDVKSAKTVLDIVLGNSRHLVSTGKLNSRALLKAAGGRVTETELRQFQVERTGNR